MTIVMSCYCLVYIRFGYYRRGALAGREFRVPDSGTTLIHGGGAVGWGLGGGYPNHDSGVLWWVGGGWGGRAKFGSFLGPPPPKKCSKRGKTGQFWQIWSAKNVHFLGFLRLFALTKSVQKKHR